MEIVNRAVKWNEIWDPGLVVQCIWGAFDLLVFKVILGTYALISNLHIT